MHVIAKEEVEVERLERQIAKTEARLNREKTEIVRLRDDLSSPPSFRIPSCQFRVLSQAPSLSYRQNEHGEEREPHDTEEMPIHD